MFLQRQVRLPQEQHIWVATYRLTSSARAIMWVEKYPDRHDLLVDTLHVSECALLLANLLLVDAITLRDTAKPLPPGNTVPITVTRSAARNVTILDSDIHLSRLPCLCQNLYERCVRELIQTTT